MQTPGQDAGRYEARAEEPTEADCDAAARLVRRAPLLDNREAMAYIVFREFGCSRDQALKVVDEMIDLVPSIRRIARRAWRRPRR